MDGAVSSPEPVCQYIVGYEREVPGSDAADPRIRCGEPAVVQLDSGMWVCAAHRDSAAQSGA